MQIIGHRGAAGLAPENTRASFKAALIAGVDAIEFDVRATSDGRVVIIHDRHTMRVAGKPHFISRTLYSKIKALRLKDGHSIPTLAEAFNTIDGQAKIIIELKSSGCAKAVVQNIQRLVKNGASYADFTIISFKVTLLREVWEMNGKIPLVLLQFHRPFSFMKVGGLHLSGVGFHHRIMPQKAIKEAHLHGLNVFAYTVNSPVRAYALQRRGVDAIATNRPDLMQDLRKLHKEE